MPFGTIRKEPPRYDSFVEAHMKRILLVRRILSWHLRQRLSRSDLPPIWQVLVNFFPPYNLACAKFVEWMTFHVSERTLRIANWLLDRGVLYGALRNVSPAVRARFANAVGERFGYGPAVSSINSEDSIVHRLREDGWVALGAVMSAEDVAEGRMFFDRQSGYFGQVPAQSDGRLVPYHQFADSTLPERYFSFSPEISLGCPPLRRFLASRRIRDIVDLYVGPEAQIYSVNTFSTKPGTLKHYVMRWHRDYDDFRCLAIFLYWTDVEAENGATLVVPKSQLLASSATARANVVALTGPGGHAFALEPFAIHAGNEAVRTSRLTTWVRFGYPQNLASIQDGYWSRDWAALWLGNLLPTIR
jgi:hypothetical protein